MVAELKVTSGKGNALGVSKSIPKKTHRENTFSPNC